MTSVEGGAGTRPSRVSVVGEKGGKKMWLGFRERETTREREDVVRLQAASSTKAFSLLGLSDGGNAERFRSFPMTKNQTAKRLEDGRGSS